MTLLDQLNERYATKLFDPAKKIPATELEKILEAIRLSASSLGLQPYRILIIEDPEVRQKLRKVAWDQSQITDASQLLVFAVDYDFNEKDADKYLNLVAKTRNTNIESLSGYASMIKSSLQQPAEQLESWLTKQAYIALGFGLVAAAHLGIDSCPMEGFDPIEFDKILKLQELGLKSKIVLALGYRSEEDKYQHLPKVRRPKQELFIQI
jgi:nitroreductase / dihydropteridine reductase